MSGSGISWAICKSAPGSRQTTTPAPLHSVFYGPDALLPLNQQRQSTEGIHSRPTYKQRQKQHLHRKNTLTTISAVCVTCDVFVELFVPWTSYAIVTFQLSGLCLVCIGFVFNLVWQPTFTGRHKCGTSVCLSCLLHCETYTEYR